MSDIAPSMTEAVAAARRVRLLLLSIYPVEGPSVRHRILNYRPYWQADGIDLAVNSFLTTWVFERRRRFGFWATVLKLLGVLQCVARIPFWLASVRRYDVVIIHREIFPLGGATLERMVARLNRRMIYDFDDALWITMPLAVNQRAMWWNPQRFADMMASAAAVVAGNTTLAAYASNYCARTRIIPTPYPDLGGGAACHRQDGSRPIIVWIGNVGNDEYLDIVRRPLQRLARKFQFTFRIIGSAEAESFAIDGVDVDSRQWCAEHEATWLLESSVGIMPLYDRDYERGKCSFKIIQYFSAGMPVVASPVGMNAEVVEPGCNGFLATSEEEWYASLEALLGDPSLCSKLGKEAYVSYQRRFTLASNAASWSQLIHEVAREAR